MNGCMEAFSFLVCKEHVGPVPITVLSWFGAGVGFCLFVCFAWFGFLEFGGEGDWGGVFVWWVFLLFVFAMRNIQDASSTQNE